MKHLLLAAAACLALAACNSNQEAPRSRIALQSCRLPGVDSAVRCGTYEVWEDRAAKSGRRIKLNIAVIPARISARETDPMFVFAGGPGQGAVSIAAQVQGIFSRLNDTRDVVLIDQRGTGKSHPLECANKEQPVQAMFEDALPERLVERCLEGLDADPRQYITTIAVADIDEVRDALGYNRINVWGASYGTRFALEYLRRYGDHVRSVVLDGVAPSTMKLPLSFVADGEAALGKLIDACDAEERCRKAYPNLRETIESMKGRLAQASTRVSIQDPRTAGRASISVTENVYLSSLFRPLYVAELASLLPYGVAAAEEGDFNPLLAQNLQLVDSVAENLSVGLHLSVVCAEDIPRITPEDLAHAAGSFFGTALVDDFVRACRRWPAGKVPADFYEPVRSDVPVLIFSGGIDPATPPYHAEEVARTLTKSRHFIAPWIGHGVSTHGCAPRLIESFVRAGSVDGLDGKCLEKIPRPLFLLPLGNALD
ncbi:MAG TPA: alpha/beta hydrolase [Usitatibacter sp.]|jgi:pimeloyl-ACP methyl ester carboxylesterase